VIHGQAAHRLRLLTRPRASCSSSPELPWLGRLPGDIYVGAELDVLLPLATSILISVVLTLMFWLFGAVIVRAALLVLALLATVASAASVRDDPRRARRRGPPWSSGTDIVVTEAGCEICPLRPWRTDVVRASVGGVAVEIDGRRPSPSG